MNLRKFRTLFFINLLTVLLSGCYGVLTPDNNLNPGGIPPHQQTGLISIGPVYRFRFSEKWQISHAWVQGVNVAPCRYRGNVFNRLPGYPSLASEPQGPMFENNGRIYSATAFKDTGDKIIFFELSSQILGERISDRTFEGKYTPFCAQFFSASRNGMSLSIIKPDPAKGTDAWIADSAPKTINGRTWLVKTVPSKDLSETGLIQPIEYWTLKIPSTPYWMHLTFSASLDHSVRKHGAELDALLDLFHQVIESVRLEPIVPIDPALMPPFVLYQTQQPQRKSPQ